MGPGIGPLLRSGVYLCNVRKVVLEEIQIQGAAGPCVTRDNCRLITSGRRFRFVGRGYVYGWTDKGHRVGHHLHGPVRRSGGSPRTGGFAHHSIAMYDKTRTITLNGVVKRYEWANPHVYLTIVETTPGGTVDWNWNANRREFCIATDGRKTVCR